MIEIDGSQKSGSGTILRLSVALAAILGQPLHIYNIRQNRPQPGLRPQHLEAVLTAARLCDAELKGAELNSRELWFNPKKVKGGKIEAEIGTAGSIPMLLLTVFPICAFAEKTVHLHVTKGGTDVSHAPTVNYVRFVLLPTLKRMGIDAFLTVQRYGYYPKGMGEVTVNVEPCKSPKPFYAGNFGKIKAIRGVSVCTFLAERKVAERQAKVATDYLREKGYTADIQIVNDKSNPLQKGSSLVLWAETNTNAYIGADAIGELRKTSEAVGKEAAEKLYVEVAAKPTVDVHLADMLIPYMALAKGKSAYLTRAVSDHLETNIWLVEKILGVKFNVQKTNWLYKVEKVG
ncbi:MAG: RNA 3'-terminal phosphate cyclase [Candidatus Bathyarchaeota archaeon]|nr:RNA 3'-terminal phosphate cyclase [Candidatus Bathyarchaeota archaeon A05DMB-5]MDH7557438.1 RNA 3'-terminal phosphate cyclase [Candidatus Bathyarchaeota archaeon]